MHREALPGPHGVPDRRLNGGIEGHEELEQGLAGGVDLFLGEAPEPEHVAHLAPSLPAAPFIVIPSAMDAESGERKRLPLERLACARRSKAKRLFAAMSSTSAALKARGSWVISSTPSDGPVARSPHPAATNRRRAPTME